MAMSCRKLVSTSFIKERNQGALLLKHLHCLINVQIKILGLMLLWDTAAV